MEFYLIIGIFVIGVIIYGVIIGKRIAFYKQYLNIDNPYGMTGEMVIAEICQRRHKNTRIAISQISSIDPFEGNYYLTDQDVLVLQRPILHGRSVLSFCIAGQLASDLCDYKEGDLRKSTIYKGSSVILYKLDKNAIINLGETAPYDIEEVENAEFVKSDDYEYVYDAQDVEIIEDNDGEWRNT